MKIYSDENDDLCYDPKKLESVLNKPNSNVYMEEELADAIDCLNKSSIISNRIRLEAEKKRLKELGVENVDEIMKPRYKDRPYTRNGKIMSEDVFNVFYPLTDFLQKYEHTLPKKVRKNIKKTLEYLIKL